MRSEGRGVAVHPHARITAASVTCSVPPVVYRSSMDVETASASHELQCPHCQRSHPVVQKYATRRGCAIRDTRARCTCSTLSAEGTRDKTQSVTFRSKDLHAPSRP